MAVNLEVFSDIACPWCFIGKRRLFETLGSDANADEVSITWRAFMLQPGLPAEGLPAREFYRQKFGSEGAVQAAFDRVTQAGKSVGIHFNFEAMKVAANTKLAHRAIKVCAALGEGNAATEALFRAHFEDGANVGMLADVMAALERHKVPVDLSEVKAALQSGAGDDAVEQDVARAAALGVGGVPLFLAPSAKGLLAVEGAQSPEVLRLLLARAREAKV